MCLYFDQDPRTSAAEGRALCILSYLRSTEYLLKLLCVANLELGIWRGISDGPLLQQRSWDSTTDRPYMKKTIRKWSRHALINANRAAQLRAVRVKEEGEGLAQATTARERDFWGKSHAGTMTFNVWLLCGDNIQAKSVPPQSSQSKKQAYWSLPWPSLANIAAHCHHCPGNDNDNNWHLLGSSYMPDRAC